jgi:hypothetical protein
MPTLNHKGNNKQMPIIQGKSTYAKVLGKPGKAYKIGETEWSIDVTPNEAGVAQLRADGLKTKLKNKGDERNTFITFKRTGTKKDGTPAKPISVVGPDREPWPQEKLIGNGSIVNIKYVVNEAPYEGKVYLKPGIIGIQVVKHVPYEGKPRDDDFQDYNGDENWED